MGNRSSSGTPAEVTPRSPLSSGSSGSWCLNPIRIETGTRSSLVCELVRENGWKYCEDTDSRVEGLSTILQQLSTHPNERRGPIFRNANAVARKTSDILITHPDYQGRKTNGNRLDGVVLAEFLKDPARMTLIAAAIREAVDSTEVLMAPPEPDLDDAPAIAGGVLERRHIVRERDPRLRQWKIESVLKKMTASPVRLAVSTLRRPTGRGDTTTSSAIT